MQTYLGLDIGTYSIKAVILKVSFEHCYIEDMREQEISLSQNTDEKTSKIHALKALISTLNEKNFDSIYTSLGCQFTVMKRFDLNNVKRSNRQKILESEFDLLGLFNLNDYTIEYHTIKFDTNYAKLLGILIHKPSALQLIDILTQCELNVRIIDIDNISYLNLVNYLPSIGGASSRGVELFLDHGHSKTSLTIIEKNKVINTRTFNIGGMHLTNLIKNKLNLSYEEARSLKHDMQSSGKHYPHLQNIIEGFFEELCSELKRTIKSINATEFIKLDRIFLLGGGSNLEGVQSIFEKKLETEIINLTLINKDLKFPSSNNVNFLTFSQAISVALRGNLSQTNSKINIRHGALALISNYEKIIAEVAKYAKLVALFVIVLFGTYMLRTVLFNHRITEMKTYFKKEIVQMFTTEPKELKFISAKGNWDFNEYSQHAIKLVKDSIHDKKEFINDMSTNNVSMPLKILNQISLIIPKEIYFEMVDFKCQDNILYFEADTTSSESVEKIMAKLKGLETLNQIVKKSEVKKAGSDSQLVHFTVTANIIPKGG